MSPNCIHAEMLLEKLSTSTYFLYFNAIPTHTCSLPQPSRPERSSYSWKIIALVLVKSTCTDNKHRTQRKHILHRIHTCTHAGNKSVGIGADAQKRNTYSAYTLTLTPLRTRDALYIHIWHTHTHTNTHTCADTNTIEKRTHTHTHLFLCFKCVHTRARTLRSVCDVFRETSFGCGRFSGCHNESTHTKLIRPLF